MDDVRAVEGAHDVCDRIHFADVRKELIAKTFALRCAGDEPGNINKLNGRRQDLFGLRNRRKLSKPRIRHRHNTDIRVDRAERIVFCGDLRAGKRVEERGLTDIGQADDAAFDAIRRSRDSCAGGASPAVAPPQGVPARCRQRRLCFDESKYLPQLADGSAHSPTLCRDDPDVRCPIASARIRPNWAITSRMPL